MMDPIGAGVVQLGECRRFTAPVVRLVDPSQLRNITYAPPSSNNRPTRPSVLLKKEKKRGERPGTPSMALASRLYRHWTCRRRADLSDRPGGKTAVFGQHGWTAHALRPSVKPIGMGRPAKPGSARLHAPIDWRGGRTEKLTVNGPLEPKEDF